MKNLSELKIVNTDYDLESGFFWVEFQNGKSIQCCLVQDDNSAFVARINSNDTGASEGLSSDNNEWALSDDCDWGHINDLLITEAKKLGIEIV